MKVKVNLLMALVFLIMALVCFEKVGVFSNSDVVKRCVGCLGAERSIYSQFMGLPTLFMGGVGYLLISMLSLFVAIFNRFEFLNKLFTSMREFIFLFAVGVHSYLAYVMFTDLESVCKFCLVMFSLVMLGAATNYWTLSLKAKISKGMIHTFMIGLVFISTSSSYANVKVMESVGKDIDPTMEEVEKTMILHVYEDMACTSCYDFRNQFLPKVKKLYPFVEIIEKEVNVLDAPGGKKALIFTQIAKILGKDEAVKEALFSNIPTWTQSQNPYASISHLLSEDEVMKTKSNALIKMAIDVYHEEYYDHNLIGPPGVVLEYGKGQFRRFNDKNLSYKLILDVIDILNKTQKTSTKKEN